MARPATQKQVTQKVTPMKTRKNPKLPSLGDNVGLKRKRGAEKKSLDLGVGAIPHEELENDLTNDKE